jgi:hypothetical protein
MAFLPIEPLKIGITINMLLTRNPMGLLVKIFEVSLHLLGSNAFGQFQTRNQTSRRVTNFGVIFPYHMKDYSIITFVQMMRMMVPGRSAQMKLDGSCPKSLSNPHFGVGKVRTTSRIRQTRINHPNGCPCSSL